MLKNIWKKLSEKNLLPLMDPNTITREEEMEKLKSELNFCPLIRKIRIFVVIQWASFFCICQYWDNNFLGPKTDGEGQVTGTK